MKRMTLERINNVLLEVEVKVPLELHLVVVRELTGHKGLTKSFTSQLLYKCMFYYNQ